MPNLSHPNLTRHLEQCSQSCSLDRGFDTVKYFRCICWLASFSNLKRLKHFSANRFAKSNAVTQRTIHTFYGVLCQEAMVYCSVKHYQSFI